MSERRANIDLLFRNGLKDYEALPPEDLWEKISPAVPTRKRNFFTRFAAAVLAIASLGGLTWLLTRDTTTEFASSYADFRIPGSSPVLVRGTVDPAPSLLASAGFTQPVNVIQDGNEVSAVQPPADPVETKMPGSAGIIVAGSGTPGLIVSAGRSNNVYQPFEPVIPGYEPVKNKVSEKWSISALASPTYYSSTGSKADEIYDAEQSAASYAGGLAVSYRISRRLSVQTGVYYSSHGRNITGINSFAGFSPYSASKGTGNFEIITSGGTVVTQNPDVFILGEGSGNRVYTEYTNDVFDPRKANLSYVDNSIIQSFSYLQMPVVLRYKVVDRNLDINLAGGISSDFLIGNTAYARTGSGRYNIGETSGARNLVFSGSLGMGVEYNFSGRISLNLEPTFRYFLNPFSTTTITGNHPYSFGFFSGFSYRF